MEVSLERGSAHKNKIEMATSTSTSTWLYEINSNVKSQQNIDPHVGEKNWERRGAAAKIAGKKFGAKNFFFRRDSVKNFTRHFWANFGDRPGILSFQVTERKNPGTFAKIRLKVAFRILEKNVVSSCLRKKKCFDWSTRDVLIGAHEVS